MSRRPARTRLAWEVPVGVVSTEALAAALWGVAARGMAGATWGCRASAQVQAGDLGVVVGGLVGEFGVDVHRVGNY